MPKIDLRVSVPHLNDTLKSGARVDVLPIGVTPHKGNTRHGALVDVTPQGFGGADLGEFEAGRYLVRAELPSGEMLEQLVELGADATPIVLEGEASSHDWLATAQTIGATRPRSRIDKRAIFQKTSLSGPARLMTNAMSKREDVWEAVLAARTEGEPTDEWRVVDRDETTESWERTKHHPGVETLLVDAADGDWWIVSPTSWLIEPGFARVQLTLAHAEGSYAAAGPSLVVHDAELAPVMGWLRRGRADVVAGSVAENAIDWLSEKASNPCRAALGAYVLLEATSGAVEEKHFAWIQRLSASWLPDAPLLHAHARLERPDAESNVERIFHDLNLAYERGLPLFTVGMQRLLDGFLVVADFAREHRDHDQHQARIRRIRAVASRARTDRVFTTIRLEAR